MSEQNHNSQENPGNPENQENQENQPRKITLEEAIKRKLAQKKQEQANQRNGGKLPSETKVLKSQQTKKPNNQRRRTGGS